MLVPVVRRSAAALVVAAVLSLSGCSLISRDHKFDGTVPLQDPGVHALVDSEAGRIVLPLDVYVPSARDRHLYDHAHALYNYLCGSNYLRAELDDTIFRWYPMPDYRYGLWLPWQADYYDPYSTMQVSYLQEPLPEFPDRPSPDLERLRDYRAHPIGHAPVPLMDQEWCSSHRLYLADVYATEGPPWNMVLLWDIGVAQGASLRALARSELFRQEADKYAACLRAHGLDGPRVDERGNPELRLAPGYEILKGVFDEQRRGIARIDIGCKEQLGTVQTLADWEARWQLGLLRDTAVHEELLGEYRLLFEEEIAEIHAFLDEYGHLVPR